MGQSARNPGEWQLDGARSERTPAHHQPHAAPDMRRKRSGHREAASTGVTFGSSWSFGAPVLLDDELHGPVDRQLHDPGLLVDPAVGGRLLRLLLPQFGR